MATEIERFRDHCRDMQADRGKVAEVARMVGLQTDANRALWGQLADEIDVYLTHDAAEDHDPLWEDA